MVVWRFLLMTINMMVMIRQMEMEINVTIITVVELGETSGGVEPVEEGWVELPILPVDLTPSSTGVVPSWRPAWR